MGMGTRIGNGMAAEVDKSMGTEAAGAEEASEAALPFSPGRLRSFFLAGKAGRLEALAKDGRADAPYAALVAHPHPKGGGTMHNKVVYHAAKAFSSCGLPVLRFNFRGAGLSEGAHDDGRGEIEDVQAAVDWLEKEYALPVIFAGFSFGSNVGLRAFCVD